MPHLDSSPAQHWLVYPNDNVRFPYRLLIEHESGRFLNYEVQDSWPGPGRSIFCIARPELSEPGLPAGTEPADCCNILTLKRFGRKLTVLLDRKNRKRSWFITVERESKTTPGKKYQQTFWITQSSAAAHRGGAYLSNRGRDRDIAIVKDSRERYGYNFGAREVEKAALPVGDYALRDAAGEILAVVERKTREQFLGDVATLEVLKARLLEMTSRYRYAALVVEATYADLVDPKKNRFYSGGFIADIIADLHAGLPGLQVVFCTNRKFAREWVERYFARIAHIENPPETTSDRPQQG